MYGYVFHDKNGPNLGHTLQIQWFLLSETCTDTHLRDWYGKDNSRKFYGNLNGKKVPHWECLFVHRKPRITLIQKTWMTWKRLERSRIWLQRGRNWWNSWILTNQHHFSTMCICDALNVNVTTQRTVRITKFRYRNWKVSYQGWKNLTQKQSRGPTTWKGTRKSAWRGIVTGKQKDGASEHRFNDLLGWSQLQEEGVGNSRRIVRGMFSNRLKMLVFGSNW